MDYLSGMDKEFTLKLSIIMVAIGFLVLILDFYIVRKSVTAPINELSNCAGRFAYATEEDRKNNIRLLEELNINTGDEIEDVYHVLQSVARDSFEATSNLSQAQMELKDREGMITAMAADYRSLYYVNLDRDECTCVRSTSKAYADQMWEGKVFPFAEGFENYALHCVAECDREGFLKFLDPDFIRSGLSKEKMLSHRYLATYNNEEKYEMLRIAGVRTIEERDDHTVHAIGVGFSDVDRQTRGEMEHNRALTEALARAEEANAAKTAFLSSMSHEIRTPMNAIIGLDNIALKDPTISETTRKELENIGSSARHLLSLINDILDMSRIESGRLMLNMAEFSFREMLDQINIIIRGQCDDKQLTYDSRVIGEVNDYFVGDTLRIRQIIINILGNSVKFTDSPGTVTFTVEQTEEADDRTILHFTMKDTGIGMDEEFIPKLFEPFSQEDATTTNRYGGSGLGMAITKNMINLMGGSIRVESVKNSGTTFFVDIPLQRSARIEESEDELGQSSDVISIAGIHVLIAEDMMVNANILIMMLKMEQVTTEWAENGQLAVERFAGSEEGHFDAILMDMRMPVMDGLTATREIRKLDRPDAKSIPIIALTANAFEEDVQNCLQAGMNAHLSKPVDMDKLKECLGRMLTERDMADG
jgi:signal transduction histidine kinase/ActR/RegA family two-component response regulator